MRALAGCFFTGLMLASAGPTTARDETATGTAARTEDRYPERRISFPEGVTGLADVTYSTPAGFRPLTLDLYLPQTRKRVPAIV